MRESIDPPSLSTPNGYSHVVKTSGGTTIYVAGQVAIDSDGKLMGEGDLETQTRQVFTNLVAALQSAGAEPADLVKIGIYVVDHDPAKLEIIRRVRDELWGDTTPPASTLLGVDALALDGLLVEIDGVAVIPD